MGARSLDYGLVSLSAPMLSDYAMADALAPPWLDAEKDDALVLQS